MVGVSVLLPRLPSALFWVVQLTDRFSDQESLESVIKSYKYNASRLLGLKILAYNNRVLPY